MELGKTTIEKEYIGLKRGNCLVTDMWEIGVGFGIISGYSDVVWHFTRTMKNIFLIVLLSSPLVCTGQVHTLPDTSRIKIADNVWAKPGTCYLDLVEVDLSKIYLDPENVKDMRVIKGEGAKLWSGAKGVTVITRKEKKELLTLGYIADKFPADSLKSFRFIIDDKFVADTSGVRLEEAVIKNMKVLRNATGKVDHGFSQSVDIFLTTVLNKKD
ncbi:MAG: hypothetical protein ACK5RG_14020 [Cyclobacteriaceae bacterium]